MSDRTLPRSLRTIEGFGVHSFRLNNGAGDSTFVKFHWRPKLGLQSTIWDEAVKAASDAGATVKIIALKVGGAKLADGSKLAADGQLAGTPSVLFDAIAIILSAEGAKALSLESAAIKVKYPASRLENI